MRHKILLAAVVVRSPLLTAAASHLASRRAKMNTYNYGAPGPARSTAKYGITNPMGEGNVRPAPDEE